MKTLFHRQANESARFLFKLEDAKEQSLLDDVLSAANVEKVCDDCSELSVKAIVMSLGEAPEEGAMDNRFKSVELIAQNVRETCAECINGPNQKD